MGLLDKLFFRNKSTKPTNNTTAEADDSHAENLISIEFENKTDEIKRLWIEPTCVEFTLDKASEFMLVAKDDTYAIQFNTDYITLFLQYTFDLRLYKRPISEEFKNPNEWELIEDYFDLFI